jgi:hypothetical protein
MTHTHGTHVHTLSDGSPGRVKFSTSTLGASAAVLRQVLKMQVQLLGNQFVHEKFPAY